MAGDASLARWVRGAPCARRSPLEKEDETSRDAAADDADDDDGDDGDDDDDSTTRLSV